MHELHLVIIVIGVVSAVAVVSMYYWAAGRLATHEHFNAVLLGCLLGVAAIGAQYYSYIVFSVLVGFYVAYFIYLKSHFDSHWNTAGTMASLVIGTVIGVSGLLGCIVCNA